MKEAENGGGGRGREEGGGREALINTCALIRWLTLAGKEISSELNRV